jgi:hypothetical protein
MIAGAVTYDCKNTSYIISTAGLLAPQEQLQLRNRKVLCDCQHKIIFQELNGFQGRHTSCGDDVFLLCKSDSV